MDLISLEIKPQNNTFEFVISTHHHFKSKNDFVDME